MVTVNLYHCLKTIQIPSYFWPVFSRIRTEYGETEYLSVFSLNVGKYGPEMTLYLDIFHAVYNIFENPTKRSCFVRILVKTNSKSRRLNFRKWGNIIFNGPYFCKENVYVILGWMFNGNIWHLWSWPIFQKIQKSTILPWISTEASNFQVKFDSGLTFNNWFIQKSVERNKSWP